jgi:hypothetical protein
MPSYDFDPPPPPSPVLHTGRLRKRDNLLTGEGGKGVRKEVKNTTSIKPDLYKSFSTLWAGT